MKKIIMAAGVAAVMFGAFADPKINLNIRSGGYLVNVSDFEEAHGATTIGDLDGMTGTDSFKLVIETDYAGVKIDYQPKIGEDSDSGNSAKSFWDLGNGNSIQGWVKPASWLKLQIGAEKDGLFTAEQVKKDTDDTNWSAAGKYAFLYKPGILTKNSTGYFLDSLVDWQNNGAQYALADLAFNDLGPGNLKVRLVATSLEGAEKETTTYYVAAEKSGSPTTKMTSTSYSDLDFDVHGARTISAMPGVMVGYEMKDLFKANIDFQMVTQKDIAFGIYASPLMVKNLTAMVGYTFSTNTADADSGLGAGLEDTTYHGIDLRLRYIFFEKLFVTNAFNYTMSSEDGTVLQANGSKALGDAQLWDSLFIVYKLNDKIWITGNFQVDMVFDANAVNSSKSIYDGGKATTETTMDMYATLGAVYHIGKGAAITAGLTYIAFDVTEVGEGSDGSLTIANKAFTIPVLMRIKL